MVRSGKAQHNGIKCFHDHKKTNAAEIAMTKSTFLARVTKTQSCWLWQGAVRSRKTGYGSVKIAGKAVLAHRLSYQLFNGEIPDGKFVCHKCDNPICVNPAHLFVGSHADNMKDAWKKGRLPIVQTRTARPPASAKLNYEKVEQIRLLINERRKVKDIAHSFSVSRFAVSRIKNGKTWANKPVNDNLI